MLSRIFLSRRRSSTLQRREQHSCRLDGLVRKNFTQAGLLPNALFAQRRFIKTPRRFPRPNLCAVPAVDRRRCIPLCEQPSGCTGFSVSFSCHASSAFAGVSWPFWFWPVAYRIELRRRSCLRPLGFSLRIRFLNPNLKIFERGEDKLKAIRPDYYPACFVKNYFKSIVCFERNFHGLMLPSLRRPFFS